MEGLDWNRYEKYGYSSISNGIDHEWQVLGELVQLPSVEANYTIVK